MGVLDDAIRQHLELKRAHGADEAELRRKEDEALGPARRSVPETEDAAPADAEPAEELLAEDAAVSAPPPVEDDFFAEADEPFAREPAPVPPEPASAVDDAPLPAEPAAAEPLDADEAPLAEDAAVEEDFAYDDEPLPRAAESEPRVAADPEPEATLEPRAPEGDEDVLEETPDFLQETPEHDRLWFEQKPPRDFDFDDDDR